MNTESPPTTTEPTPAAKQESPTLATAYRGNGKIARLPRPIRDQINHWLADGFSYPDIIKRLGDHGKGLKPDHLCEWKKRGYKDWLAEQAFISRTRSRQETPEQLVGGFDGTVVNHAALQLGTLYIFEALRDLSPGSLNEKLGGDCSAFARLIHALARASRETMQLQKYRQTCAQARAALQELKDPNRKLTENETRAIVLKVDDILGLTTPDPAPQPQPPAPVSPNSDDSGSAPI